MTFLSHIDFFSLSFFLSLPLSVKAKLVLGEDKKREREREKLINNMPEYFGIKLSPRCLTQKIKSCHSSTYPSVVSLLSVLYINMPHFSLTHGICDHHSLRNSALSLCIAGSSCTQISIQMQLIQ